MLKGRRLGGRPSGGAGCALEGDSGCLAVGVLLGVGLFLLGGVAVVPAHSPPQMFAQLQPWLQKTMCDYPGRRLHLTREPCNVPSHASHTPAREDR